MIETENNVVTPEQYALAIYLSIFTKTVDKLIAETGHAVVMQSIPAANLGAVFEAFAESDDPLDLFKKVKDICPSVFPSCHKSRLLYLRKPFEIGMIIAKQYFGTTDQKLVTGAVK